MAADLNNVAEWYDGKAATFAGQAPSPSNELTLWYRRPANVWNEALPVGNGRLGAMVFGGVHRERIQLNEETLWDGYPRETTNPKAFEAMQDARRLVFDGREDEAEYLANKSMLGYPYTVKPYQTLGDLRIETPAAGTVEDYCRCLDLDTALGRLEAIDEEKAALVTLRYLLGCTVEETAAALRVSPAKVKKDWTFAKPWLHHELEAPER